MAYRFLSGILSFSLLLMSFNTFASSSEADNTPKINPDEVISRKILFSDPEFTQVRISPDGKHLAYLAPSEGVLNVWVGNLDGKTNMHNMHPVTHNKIRGVSNYFWAYNNDYIVFMDDSQGNEDWRIYRVDIKTGKQTTVASFPKVQARVLAASHKFPDEILLSLNQRRSDLHDIYRLNLVTGKMTLVYENNEFSDFIVDDDYNVALGFVPTKEGGIIVNSLNKNFAKTELFKIGNQDSLTTSPFSLDKTGNILYLVDSRNRNTAALMAMDLKTKKSTMLAQNDKADISDVMMHPTERTLQAAASTYEKQQWTILDKSIQPDIDYLNQVTKGSMEVISRSLDDKKWIVVYLKDNGSPRYYAYDRTKHHAHFLFASKKALDTVPLTQMEPVIIPSRDGFKLVSYLSLPASIQKENGRVTTPVPMVLLVHGGPHARDEWGYNSEHQWLANRGYAVLSVNYRGSSGFGKKFANAGNGEWAGKMHNDLLDAVNWAIDQGITTKDKVAIMGGSYGGYATLVGLTKSPDVFCCGVDIVGPSNLETFMKSIPAYWGSFYSALKIMIGGDPDTEKGRKFLASRSPITFVNNIKKPLLIAQGANDPRVKLAESDQIVQKMTANKIPVTYVFYPDEGHGFHRPQNRMSFNAVVEAFLAQNLGGKFEPIKDDFKNSSIEIKVGKEYIPILK